MDDTRGHALAAVGGVVAVLAGLATTLGFLMDHDIVPNPFGTAATAIATAGPGTSTPTADQVCRDPHISLSRGSGPSGTQVTVTGTTFPADQKVSLEFSTEDLPAARTDARGHFQVSVVIPGTLDAFAPRQVAILATTTPDVCFDSEPFELTAS